MEPQVDRRSAREATTMVIGVLCLVAGAVLLLCAVRPGLVIRRENGAWAYRNPAHGEPSAAYVTVTRLAFGAGGLFLIGLGLIVILGPFDDEAGRPAADDQEACHELREEFVAAATFDDGLLSNPDELRRLGVERDAEVAMERGPASAGAGAGETDTVRVSGLDGDLSFRLVGRADAPPSFGDC